jgi:IMP dehydrogenase
MKHALCFDDVLLVPQYSDMISRSAVDLSVRVGDLKLANPIIPANMKTVSGKNMLRFCIRNKMMGLYHRFSTPKTRIETLESLSSLYKDAFRYIGVSVGIQGEDKAFIREAYNLGVRTFCVDIAHGHSKACAITVEWLRQFKNVLIIAGNVATASGAKFLLNSGADIVKASIGGGSLCTTRIQTGHGIPTLQALMDIRAMMNEDFEDREVYLIADGGVRTSGDCVKALCFADLVMCGNIFAGTKEAPGKAFVQDGKLVKKYVGSSTHKSKHIEGVTAMVPFKGPAQEVLQGLLEGISSGCSYAGVRDLKKLRELPSFVTVSTNGLRESHPHSVLNF